MIDAVVQAMVRRLWDCNGQRHFERDGVMSQNIDGR